MESWQGDRMTARFPLLVAVIASASCAPPREARAAREVRSEEVVITLDPERTPPPAVPRGPSEERYGHEFDEDPLAASRGGQDGHPSRVPADPTWKCQPSSTCEVRDVLELHKHHLAACHARARATEVRFTARVRIR